MTEVYGSLSDWDLHQFVPVSIEAGNFYGGRQSWLPEVGVSKFYANRACGVTALANAFYYMAQHLAGKRNLYDKKLTADKEKGSIDCDRMLDRIENNPGNNKSSERSNITTKVVLSKDEFNDFQREIYDYLRPAIWGLPIASTLIKRALAFARDRGVELEVRRPDFWREDDIRDFIAQALNRNRPVMLLTWYSSQRDLRMHWVTVTRLYDQGQRTMMVTSNWGQMKTYDFSVWVNEFSIYKDLVCFE